MDRLVVVVMVGDVEGIPTLWNTDMDTLSLTKLFLIIKRQS